uniref:Uncharacterized protein n=1 Tax=Rhizophora mucronata TaxID=61149 RepID=A0A2P2MYK3_RHIMU
MLGDKHEVGHAVFGFPKQWLNRTGKKDELTNPSRDANGGIYDGFSETQTESQVLNPSLHLNWLLP